MKKKAILAPLLLSFFGYAQTEKSDLKNPNDNPTMSKCTPINDELKIENHYGVSITYTEIEYTCDNLRDGHRNKILCKGNWLGDLKGCYKNRFSLVAWKSQVEKDKLQTPDTLKNEVLDNKAKGGSTK